MNETELLQRVYDILSVHSGCEPKEYCSLWIDLTDLLTLYFRPIDTLPALCICGNLITIADPGTRCRQCVLLGR